MAVHIAGPADDAGAAVDSVAGVGRFVARGGAAQGICRAWISRGNARAIGGASFGTVAEVAIIARIGGVYRPLCGVHRCLAFFTGIRGVEGAVGIAHAVNGTVASIYGIACIRGLIAIGRAT